MRAAARCECGWIEVEEEEEEEKEEEQGVLVRWTSSVGEEGGI